MINYDSVFRMDSDNFVEFIVSLLRILLKLDKPVEDHELALIEVQRVGISYVPNILDTLLAPSIATVSAAATLAASDVAKQADQLHAAGARNIIVPNYGHLCLCYTHLHNT